MYIDGIIRGLIFRILTSCGNVYWSDTS